MYIYSYLLLVLGLLPLSENSIQQMMMMPLMMIITIMIIIISPKQIRQLFVKTDPVY